MPIATILGLTVIDPPLVVFKLSIPFAVILLLMVIAPAEVLSLSVTVRLPPPDVVKFPIFIPPEATVIAVVVPVPPIIPEAEPTLNVTALLPPFKVIVPAPAFAVTEPRPLFTVIAPLEPLVLNKTLPAVAVIDEPLPIATVNALPVAFP